MPLGKASSVSGLISQPPKSEEPTFDDFGVQQVRGLLEIYGKDIEKGGHRYPALLSDSTLPQYEVCKKLVWERGWDGGGKSDEDVYEVIIMDDSLRKLLPEFNGSRQPHAREDFLYALRSSRRSATAWEIPYWHA